MKAQNRRNLSIHFNDRGSVVIPALILGVVLSLVFAALSSRLQSQIDVQARSHVKDDVQHLRTTLMMLYSDADNCTKTLGPNGIGTTLADATAKSAAGTVQLLNPSIDANGGQVILATNVPFNQISVKSISFTQPVPVSLSGNAFLVNLNISVGTLNSPTAIESISIPLYLVQNAAGSLKSCLATTYSDASTQTTLEDALCSQLRTGQYIYDPGEHACIPASSMAGLLAMRGGGVGQ